MTDRYRVGGKQPGNIYQDDKRFAFCIRDEDGPVVAAALNAYSPPAPVPVCDEHGQPVLSCADCAPLTVGCALDESNDMEAFAALPECSTCGGTGKDIPGDFWGDGQ